MSIDEVRAYVIQWNNRFPFDRWWREKYKISFMSPAHKEANFLFQRFEYEEDKMMMELSHQNKYIPNIGEFLKPLDDNFSEEEKIKNFHKEALAEIEEFNRLNND